MTHASARLRSRLSALLLLCSCLLVAAACGGGDDGGGDAQQVGDNLDFVPSSLVTCSDGFPVQVNPTFPQPFTGSGAGSCVYLTFFPGAQPNRDGRAVRANIRVGQFTGPMRFIKMRVLYNRISGVACCSLEQYGDVFTPTANAITSVNLNFRMVEDHVPPPNDFDTIAANDLIALEVLAGNVPIPGIWVNNGGAVLTLPNYVWFPAFSVEGLTAPSVGNMINDGSMSGFQPAFNIDFVASGGSILGPE